MSPIPLGAKCNGTHDDAPAIRAAMVASAYGAGVPSCPGRGHVILPPGILSWLVTHIPFGETISREEAAATLLQREIRVRYRPMIIEVDRIPSFER